jgi:hypothetical protein
MDEVGAPNLRMIAAASPHPAPEMQKLRAKKRREDQRKAKKK